MAEDLVDSKPTIQLGWLAIGDESRAEVVRGAAEALEQKFRLQFPGFTWCHQVICQAVIHSSPRVDPLDLLERGVQAKIENGWDFALVVTENDLLARTQPYTFGVPSSALETAVLSTIRIPDTENPELKLGGLAQYLMGSMLGLDPEPEGAMMPPDMNGDSELSDFSTPAVGFALERLEDVADPRLEECREQWNPLLFRLATFWADPRGIFRDLKGYRPWKQPFQLEKLTAAAWVSALLAFLGAEVWELGVGSSPAFLGVAAITAIFSTSAFLFSGQNLSAVTRSVGMSEQIARSEMILVLSLLVGMSSLWLMLFAGCYMLASVLPGEVIQRWVQEPLDHDARMRFAAFVSSLGTLAGGLGGNLEDEDAFKARFFFDEEI